MAVETCSSSPSRCADRNPTRDGTDYRFNRFDICSTQGALQWLFHINQFSPAGKRIDRLGYGSNAYQQPGFVSRCS